MVADGNINGCGKVMRKKKKGEERGFSLNSLALCLCFLFFFFYSLTSLLFLYILGPRGTGSVILFKME